MENDEFVTIDIDITDETVCFCILHLLRSILTKDANLLINKTNFNNGTVLYHAILTHKLLQTYPLDEYMPPDHVVDEFLRENLSPASLSLLDTNYELSDQLFDLLLNEQIYRTLKTASEEMKDNEL